MKVLITGILGGIGSTLGYFLHKKGYEIVGIDDLSNGYTDNALINGEEYCKLFEEDINGPFLSHIIKTEKIDVIIHLAATSSLPQCEENPMSCYRNNTLGVLAVLEAARKNRIKKVIFASSSAVYENNSNPILTEDLVIRPTLAYPLSKKLAEDICLSYIDKYEMDISILRFFNIINGRSDFYRKSVPLVNYIVKEIINGNSPTLHSNGEQRRDYISINKVCEAIESCINKSAYGIFNVASGKTVSVNEIYAAICKKLIFNMPANYHNAEDLWKDYELNLRAEIVAKETNKYACGSNQKFYNQFGVSLNENTLEKIEETALEIKNLYGKK